MSTTSSSENSSPTRAKAKLSAPPPGGYAWWYFDAISDDGDYALTAIFFVGSVFSPTYAERVRRGERAPAEEHLGVNLALYHRGKQIAWVMSEYGQSALHSLDAHGPHIADSRVIQKPDGSLRVEIRERSAPFLAALTGWGRPVECTIDLVGESSETGEAGPTAPVELGAVDGTRHGWRMIMPRARVRVTAKTRQHSLAWQGTGYHDANWGDGRLEAAFARWSWARFFDGPHNVVLYQLQDRPENGGQRRAYLYDSRVGEGVERVGASDEAPPRACRWGLKIPSAFVAGHLSCRTGELLEETPFYARYRALLDVDGQTLTGIGEHLDLDRFAHPFVQFLLRFKTRRVPTPALVTSAAEDALRP